MCTLELANDNHDNWKRNSGRARACDASRAVRLTVSRSQREQCILSVQTRTLDRIGVLERSKASRGEADYSNSKVGERRDGGRVDARRPILEAGTGLCICTSRFVELRVKLKSEITG